MNTRKLEIRILDSTNHPKFAEFMEMLGHPLTPANKAIYEAVFNKCPLPSDPTAFDYTDFQEQLSNPVGNLTFGGIVDWLTRYTKEDLNAMRKKAMGLNFARAGYGW